MFGFLFVLFGTSVADAFPATHVVFYCTSPKKQKTIALYKQGDNFIYQYGSELSPPELQLIRSESEITKTPWPGIGHTYWNSITIENKGYSYAISSSYERNESGKSSAGVYISKGGKNIASIECDTKTGFIDNITEIVE